MWNLNQFFAILCGMRLKSLMFKLGPPVHKTRFKLVFPIYCGLRLESYKKTRLNEFESALSLGYKPKWVSNSFDFKDFPPLVSFN